MPTPAPHRVWGGWECQVCSRCVPSRESNPSRNGTSWKGRDPVSPLLTPVVPVVSSLLRAVIGGFGGTCVAPVPDVSRWGPSRVGRGNPLLSDCPGMDAGVLRPLNGATRSGHRRPCRVLNVTNDGDSSPTVAAGLSRLQSRNLHHEGGSGTASQYHPATEIGRVPWILPSCSKEGLDVPNTCYIRI